MTKPFSDDLRKDLVAAVDHGMPSGGRPALSCGGVDGDQMG